jgi:hypothetical protein
MGNRDRTIGSDAGTNPRFHLAAIHVSNYHLHVQQAPVATPRASIRE